ncbi:MAG: hypothetical protein M3Q43_01780 [Actinomycetota bacterium]|nr:hypothetical protein [Actinomycetota bacterium]
MLDGSIGLTKIAHRVLERHAKARPLRRTHRLDVDAVLDRLVPPRDS